MKCFDKRVRDRSAANTGCVLQETATRAKWQKGRIEAKYNSRDDLVNGDSGGVYRSNRVVIRLATVVPNLPTADEEVSSPQT